MLAGVANCASFAGRASERTWLTGILKHKICDQFRRGDRKWCSLDVCGSAVNNLRNENWDPASMAEDAEFFRSLDKSLSALPKRMAKAFILREIEGLCGILEIS